MTLSEVELSVASFLSCLLPRTFYCFEIKIDSCNSKVPTYLDLAHKPVVCGDVIFCHAVASILRFPTILKYLPFDTLEKTSVKFFSVFDSSFEIATVLGLPEDFCESLVETEYHRKISVQSPFFCRVWLSKTWKVVLQVNCNEFFTTTLSEHSIMINDRFLTDLVKLELFLGHIQLSVDEYLNLRPGSSITLSNFDDLKTLVKLAGTTVGEGRLIRDQQFILVFDRIRKESEFKAVDRFEKL
ncbi:MAG: FliM/FliN family flagellar motor C-terminal domain-containing protein [Deltaproteobacteria bacterium]|nr:FliM/FliN family flagellar motor C-terminal domain-containing protein [Deltaproteobacteria bacterium]